jgi:hypothetical protein
VEPHRKLLSLAFKSAIQHPFLSATPFPLQIQLSMASMHVCPQINALSTKILNTRSSDPAFHARSHHHRVVQLLSRPRTEPLLQMTTMPHRRQMADSPLDLHSKKVLKTLTCRFSVFHSQMSDVFIGFLTNSPTVRRQVKSSCWSNFAMSCCPSSITDRMGIHIGP